MEEDTYEKEKLKAALEVDIFLEILTKRYGLEIKDVVDTVRWVQEHRDFIASLRRAGAISFLGIIVSAMLLALWEGIKALITRRP